MFASSRPNSDRLRKGSAVGESQTDQLVGVERWNEVKNFYAFVYYSETHQETFQVKFLPSRDGDSLVVFAYRSSSSKSVPRQTCIGISHYVTSYVGNNIGPAFQRLNELYHLVSQVFLGAPATTRNRNSAIKECVIRILQILEPGETISMARGRLGEEFGDQLLEDALLLCNRTTRNVFELSYSELIECFPGGGGFEECGDLRVEELNVEPDDDAEQVHQSDSAFRDNSGNSQREKKFGAGLGGTPDVNTVSNLQLTKINVSSGGIDLVVDGSVTLSVERHYGLVGKTGSGRTSFLRYLSGIPTEWKVLFVDKEVFWDDSSALQCVIAQKEETKHIDVTLAASILSGLGFTQEMQKKATKTFSGKWKLRIALACALFREPDLLLLDESTNDLDLHALLWLEAYLAKWKKTFIIVSHAREFLNAVVTDILYLHGQKITAYEGSYDLFEIRREDHTKNQQALDHLGHADEAANNTLLAFPFLTPDDRSGSPIIRFRDVSFGYPGGPTILKNLNFQVDVNSRIALVGQTGIGKSTILKLVSGDLQPRSGTVYRSDKVRVGFFSERHFEGLDMSLSPFLYMKHCFPGVPEQRIQAQLADFGVVERIAQQPLKILSSGQKSRVALAKIAFEERNILLLDGPSNALIWMEWRHLLGEFSLTQEEL